MQYSTVQCIVLQAFIGIVIGARAYITSRIARVPAHITSGSGLAKGTGGTGAARQERREGGGSRRPSSGAEARCGDCDATLGEGEEDEDFPPPYDEVVPGHSQDGDLGEAEGAAARWGPETLV